MGAYVPNKWLHESRDGDRSMTPGIDALHVEHCGVGPLVAHLHRDG